MLATRNVQHVQLQCSDNVIHLDLDQPDRSSRFCYQNAMLEILHTRLHAYTLTRLHAYTLTGLHTRTR